MGKDNLQKIAEIIIANTFINNFHFDNDKIFVPECAGVTHIIRFNEEKRIFYEIAKDIMPRFTTASELLDSYTIVGADKFENVFVNRLPLDQDENLLDECDKLKLIMDNG